MNTKDYRYSAALFLISASIIAYQIILLQMLAFMQWYHFAYMIISIALLGFGCAGSILSLFREWLMQRFDRILPTLLITSSVSLVISLNLIQLDPFRFDSFLIFADKSHLVKLSLTYLLLFVPFCSGALATGIIIFRKASKIHSIYFYNLAGSATGAALVPVLMIWTTPERIASLIALNSLIAALIVFPVNTKRIHKIITFAFCSLVILGSFIYPVRLKTSEFKAISKSLDLPDASVEYIDNSAYGILHVISSPVIRNSHNVSLGYKGHVPVQKGMFENGNWKDAIMPIKAWDSLKLFDFRPDAWPYAYKGDVKSVLQLHGGAFNEALWATRIPVKRIIALEPNSQIIDYFNTRVDLDSLSALGVQVINSEPRTYLLGTNEHFDIISLPEVGTFGGSSGINSVAEDYLLTRESFKNILLRLEPDGIALITVWFDYPVKNVFRIASTIHDTLLELGVSDPAKYVLGLKNWGTITFFFKKDPFTENELSGFKEFCESHSFEPFELTDQYEMHQADPALEYVSQIFNTEETNKFVDYPFRVAPSTDNKPFFHQFIRIGKLGSLFKTYNLNTLPYFDIGYLLIWITLVQAVILSFILIILPLFRKGVPKQDRSSVLGYFGAIGLGFMFIEMIIIQNGILYFGNSVLATATAIGGLLLFSGLGSYYSAKIRLNNRVVLLLIALVLVVYSILMNKMIMSSIGSSLNLKFLIFITLTAPLAFLLGFPFPRAIYALESTNLNIIPWALGVNGFMSVVSTSLALIAAIELGFVAVWIIAAIAYLFATILVIR